MRSRDRSQMGRGIFRRVANLLETQNAFVISHGIPNICSYCMETLSKVFEYVPLGVDFDWVHHVISAKSYCHCKSMRTIIMWFKFAHGCNIAQSMRRSANYHKTK